MHHRPVSCRAVIGTILICCLLGMTAARSNAMPVRVEKAAISASAPCGSLAGTAPHVRSVVLIMMENHATPVLGSMPYLDAIAAGCARAAGYHAITHPSLPNYIALTSGRIPSGIRGGDCEPGGSCLSHDRSIFGQTGGSWRVWAQAMTRRCQRRTIGRYATRHTAAPYYTRIRSQCRARQIPLDGPRHGLSVTLNADRLPAFSLVVPDVRDDQHDGCIPCGDRFAQTWIGRIVRSAAYRRGDVAVFVTWDEDDYSAADHVPLVVVSPYTTPGSVARGHYTHYDLLRMIERTLGYPPLGAARTRSNGLARQFGLTTP
jgi:phosphatidylinositol-3-phosphatase